MIRFLRWLRSRLRRHVWVGVGWDTWTCRNCDAVHVAYPHSDPVDYYPPRRGCQGRKDCDE